ncbi:MAG: hypothetical protein KDA60_13895 [Planctomycetales bacterium]|nr:hypothetical protein [Planctomycetales bacterium]
MTRPTQRMSRSGVVLFVVLAIVVIVFLVVLGLLRHLSQSLVQAKLRHSQVQSAWLAESGLERAVYLLERDATYAGEDWQITPGDLGVGGAEYSGVVTITVQRDVDDQGNSAVSDEGARSSELESQTADAVRVTRITVVAEYPASSVNRVRTEKTVRIRN